MNSQFPAPEAQQPTSVEQQEEAEQAHRLHLAVVQSLARGRAALWDTAKALSDFDHASAWAALGYETKSHWLADPEISLTRTTYYRLIRVWRGFHETAGIGVPALAQMDPSKADIVLPAIESGAKTPEDAIADATELGWRDLRQRYWGPKKRVAGEPDPVEADDQLAASNGSSGPRMASDGAPVDVILDADAEPTDASWEKSLDAETELATIERYKYVPHPGVWSMSALEALDDVEPPPTT